MNRGNRQREKALRFILLMGIVSLLADITYEGGYGERQGYRNGHLEKPLTARRLRF